MWKKVKKFFSSLWKKIKALPYVLIWGIVLLLGVFSYSFKSKFFSKLIKKLKKTIKRKPIEAKEILTDDKSKIPTNTDNYDKVTKKTDEEVEDLLKRMENHL